MRLKANHVGIPVPMGLEQILKTKMRTEGYPIVRESETGLMFCGKQLPIEMVDVGQGQKIFDRGNLGWEIYPEGFIIESPEPEKTTDLLLALGIDGISAHSAGGLSIQGTRVLLEKGRTIGWHIGLFIEKFDVLNRKQLCDNLCSNTRIPAEIGIEFRKSMTPMPQGGSHTVSIPYVLPRFEILTRAALIRHGLDSAKLTDHKADP